MIPVPPSSILKQKMSARIEPRFPFQVPVALLRGRSQHSVQEVACRLENLSFTGLRISIRENTDLAPGEQVYLTLTILEDPGAETDHSGITISLKANVVWRRENDCGLKIVKINEDDVPIFQNLIEAMKA